MTSDMRGPTLLVVSVLLGSMTTVQPPPPPLLTVCPQDPPHCDFASTQPILDAAQPHHSILIGPGTYISTYEISFIGAMALQKHAQAANRAVMEAEADLKRIFIVNQIFWEIFNFMPIVSIVGDYLYKLTKREVPCIAPYECIDYFHRIVTIALLYAADSLKDFTALQLLGEAYRDVVRLSYEALKAAPGFLYFRSFVIASIVSELIDMLSWMTDYSQPVDELRHRAERVYGTMLMMQRALQRGQTLYGILEEKYAYGTWHGAALRLQATPTSGDLQAVALLGGDHCSDCGLKIDEIEAWVGKALKALKGDKMTLLRPYTRLRMVAFAFTRPGAQGIDELLRALNALYGQSGIPVIISWVDEDGQAWGRCIGDQGACEAARQAGWGLLLPSARPIRLL